jgi:hypothetical protein
MARERKRLNGQIRQRAGFDQQELVGADELRHGPHSEREVARSVPRLGLDALAPTLPSGVRTDSFRYHDQSIERKLGGVLRHFTLR